MTISSSQLRRAANLKDKIEKLQAELNKILGGSTAASSPASDGRKGKRRNLSAAARARIAEGQHKRWAAYRAALKAAAKK